MAKQQRTIGVFIIQLALAIYLVITGLCLTLKLGSSISSAEISAVAKLFGGASAAITILIGVILLVCGIMFCLKAIGIDLGKLDDIFKYVTLILWCIVTVVTLLGIIGELSAGAKAMHWLLVLAKNALIIGGILTIKNGK